MNSATQQTKKVNENRVRAIRIKALCAILVKLTNQDMEKKLSSAGIKLNISGLIPLRILQYGPVTIQELSKLIIVAPATLIPVIDELEAKGLITRETASTDRRKKIIHSTAKGTALIGKIMLLNKANKFVESVSAFSAADAEKLITLLERIVTDVSGTDALCKKIASNVCRQMPPANTVRWK